jgi:hypothetical protein
MIEIVGNLFGLGEDVHAVCITTNGVVNQRGAAVMGKGVAAQAKAIWPGIEFRLGDLIKANGNRTQRITQFDEGRTGFYSPDGAFYVLKHHLIALPTKNHWRERVSSLALIQRSLIELKELWEHNYSRHRIALPRPGCKNGHLDWESEHKPLV